MGGPEAAILTIIAARQAGGKELPKPKNNLLAKWKCPVQRKGKRKKNTAARASRTIFTGEFLKTNSSKFALTA
jgi:hypothetical protein